MPGWGGRAGGRSGRITRSGGSANVGEVSLKDKNFDWQRSPITKGNRAYKVVEVNVENLDNAWKALRVEKDGNGGIGDRYKNAQSFLRNNSKINMVEVIAKPNGSIDFVDGRHRFAALRDSGVKTVKVLMRDSQNWQR